MKPLDEWKAKSTTRAEPSPRRETSSPSAKRSVPEWDDVGDEFRMFLFDAFSSLRNAVKPKKRSKK